MAWVLSNWWHGSFVFLVIGDMSSWWLVTCVLGVWWHGFFVFLVMLTLFLVDLSPVIGRRSFVSENPSRIPTRLQRGTCTCIIKVLLKVSSLATTWFISDQPTFLQHKFGLSITNSAFLTKREDMIGCTAPLPVGHPCPGRCPTLETRWTFSSPPCEQSVERMFISFCK